MLYLLLLVARSQTAQPYQQNHPVPRCSVCSNNARRCCTFAWQTQHNSRLILPNSYTEAPNFLKFLYIFIYLFIYLLSSRCPFTNKLCHNGWIWDSDKCECVQHPNRQEGKDEITNGHFCFTISRLLVFHFDFVSFFYCESYSFDSTSLD